MNLTKNILYVVFLLTMLFSLSCNKTETIVEVAPGFQIEYGTQCGWCAGNESISITQDKIQYLKLIPCGEKEGTTQKERTITNEEWQQLAGAFEFEVFETLHHSECNICVDGCDEIITISKDNKTHKISYSPNTEIQEIQQLQELLKILLIEMRQMED